MQPSKRMNLVHVIRFHLRRIPPIPQTVQWICREWSHKWWLRNFRPPHSVRFALGNLSDKATFLQTFPATDCIKLNFQLSKNSFLAWLNSKTNHQLNFNLQKKKHMKKPLPPNQPPHFNQPSQQNPHLIQATVAHVPHRCLDGHLQTTQLRDIHLEESKGNGRCFDLKVNTKNTQLF